ncbi:Bis(5'-nucleosyl)-tetraphosphatase, symmetrical [Calidithermus terrae]|uniref:Bis(5'-nucleosyl)-tetraphosphatase, symmetrical n=1 Tax=Calidithermus terrae TaxID=1408545 RepID=A0A399EKZ1_9DEIN|nr:metallophosphoesterase [Calidithermus terrae]RIH83062.1 Bis(5'-nucleosyl)-tetraphosphatase, symmetrical [Calidithermus terrae]
MDCVVGDVHGCLPALVALLQRAGLLGPRAEWTGGESRLWLLGDYTDRGPDGVGVIELLMRLEEQAYRAGGAVHALLGNHDVLLLEAYHFPDAPSGFRHDGITLTFRELWLRARGQPADLERLRPEHAEWLARRPALARVEGTLLMHADSDFYLEYGSSLGEINANIRAVLQSRDPARWDRLEERFASRMAFWNGGAPKARGLLALLGAGRLVHGHTPICSVLERHPEEVREPLVYAEGLCVNLDHCLYQGGPGFVYRLD